MNAQHSCASSDWGTPAEWVERVRSVIGDIDLDPCSSVEHNDRVLARSFITAEENGLELPWRGRVFVNPPGGRGLPRLFFIKFLYDYLSGAISEGVYLGYSLEQLLWVGRLLKEKPLSGQLVAVPHSRIRFIGAGSSPTHGNFFLYLGPDKGRFKATFSPTCLVL